MLLSVATLGACSPPDAVEPARTFAYPEPRQVACDQALIPPAGIAASVTDPRFSYQVRTPANFDPDVAHPLLVVYAAATASAERSERFTQLTAEATGRGFIVAYVDHRPMSRRSVVALGAVAQSVAERWCIDPQRVYFTGHSDGATVSTALALLPESRERVAGIAVSAAGFNAQDLREMGCRASLPVMVMHGSQDQLFPGWGREAANWWAACNGCTEPTPQTATEATPDPDGCRAFAGCRPGAPVLYCEGRRSHNEWPGLQGRMLDFLLTGHRPGTAHPIAPPNVPASPQKDP